MSVAGSIVALLMALSLAIYALRGTGASPQRKGVYAAIWIAIFVVATLAIGRVLG